MVPVEGDGTAVVQVNQVNMVQVNQANIVQGNNVVQVNGEPIPCQSGTRLPDFLTSLGYQVRLIAVEYNGEILHRQFWEETLLASGDRLEVVTVVGGG